MTVRTYTGKTGKGKVSLGFAIAVKDIEVDVTALSNPKVRQQDGIATSDKLQYAGSYGLIYEDSGKDLVVSWHQIAWLYQDYKEVSPTACTAIFWWLPPGVTITLIVTD